MKSTLRRCATAAAVALSASLAVSATAWGATASAGTHARWQQRITQLPALPAGCYSASYPTVKWQPTTCQTTPAIPLGPTSAAPGRPSAAPVTVGDGKDYSSVVTGKISKAVGTFTDVSPGITEHGTNPNTGAAEANSFSLQLNTQFFTGSPACSGSVGGSCQAWQQFAYDTQGNSVFMQYWLINYDSTCPSGWTQYTTDCYKNSPTTALSGGPLTAAKLATVQLTASATAGGNDEDAVVVGSTHASMTVNPDTVLDVSKFWNTSEWNVFGSGGGNAADFGPSTATLEPETVLTSTGTLSCVDEGFTAETNNLNLTATPPLAKTTAPTMAFKEVKTSPSGASCSTSQG